MEWNTVLVCVLLQAIILISNGSSEELESIWNSKVDYSNLISLFNPTKPNFNTPGVRISEAKCNEYIWEVQHKELVAAKMAELNKLQPNTFVGIVGGRDADMAEFPHMGAVGWAAKEEVDGKKWEFLCGSFLVSDEFLITAAHCYAVNMNDVKKVAHPEPKIVRLGVENIVKDTRSPQDVEIRRFIKHPLYDGSKSKNFDIALIRLTKKIIFDKFVRPACIVNRHIRKAIVTGWGVIDRTQNSQQTADSLQVAHVDTVRSKKCSYMLRFKNIPVKKYQICAYERNGYADTCQGDSGGPLQMKMATNTKAPIYSVLGVTSFGATCASKHFPSIYTNVSSFINWIEKIVWREERDAKTITNGRHNTNQQPAAITSTHRVQKEHLSTSTPTPTVQVHQLSTNTPTTTVQPESSTGIPTIQPVYQSTSTSSSNIALISTGTPIIYKEHLNTDIPLVHEEHVSTNKPKYIDSDNHLRRFIYNVAR